ncbi:MAG: DUF805 domain-containing protein [Hahellaceae bacterium]|nr:DUF805 domain-containing protein [Hahellaceae bacterium]
MNYFLEPFQQYVTFSGRATRKQYWMFTLYFFLALIGLALIDTLGTAFLSTLFYVGSLVPYIALTTRRLHDTGRSGWWQLITLIPLIGLVILLVFLVMDSVDGNEYGPNPKREPSLA